MWWLPLATMAASAYQGQRQADKVRENNNNQAEAMKYSSWNNFTPNFESDSGPGAFGGAVQGGLAGLAAMNSFKTADGAKDVANAAPQDGGGTLGNYKFETNDIAVPQYDKAAHEAWQAKQGSPAASWTTLKKKPFG